MSAVVMKQFPTFFELTAGTTIALAFRYAAFAGLAWLFAYGICKRRWLHRKIIAGFPKSAEVWREFGCSMSSVVIFGVIGACTAFASRAGWTHLYWRIADYGWTWFGLSIAATILLHDTYFYWTHRLMHHRSLFRFFHRVHHLSHNPTPWAAYSFHPLEAVVQGAIFPLAVTIMPIHPLAFAIFMGWQITYNVLGHTGYEFHPTSLMRTPLRWVLNTPTNHIMHHEKFRGNYGLYFNVWDRVMGTNHQDYEARFSHITSRSRAFDSKNSSARSD